MHCKKKKKHRCEDIYFLFVREEEVTIQQSSKEVKESNEEVYWSGDGKKNH
jgi:hypothetical protein